MARPTATSLTTRCCEPWCSHRARNRCVRATGGSSLTHEHRSPEMDGPAGGECGSQLKPLHVHAAPQARAVGHNQPRSRDRTFDRAGVADTHQLARLDAPLHLAENRHRLRRQLRLDPAGWTERQDMLRQLDHPVDLTLPSTTRSSPPLTSPSMTTPRPYRGDAPGGVRSAGTLSARRQRTTDRSIVSKLRLDHCEVTLDSSRARSGDRSCVAVTRSHVAHHLPRPIRRQPHQSAGLAHVRLAIPRRALPVESPQMATLTPGARRDPELLLRHQPCRCVSSPSVSRRPRTTSTRPSPTAATRVP